jgi:hypothetical protein
MSGEMKDTLTGVQGRRVTLMILIVVLGALAQAVMPVDARAAETVGAGYTRSATVYPDGRAYACPTWSGGTDGAGNFYLACGRWIYKLDRNGRYLRAIEVPYGYTAYRDVAATFDGSAIYFSSGPRGGFDNPNPATHPTVGKVVKMTLQADGSYRHDASFKAGPFQLGANYWSARNLDTDLAGNVYVSVNAYVFVLNRYGTRVQAFGGDIPPPGAGGYTGWLEVPQGIAVSADGRTAYVVEQRHNHVQRWTRDGDGDWHRSTTWYLGSRTQTSNCVDNGTFASPYDVELDGAGNVYVLDVSCRRIQKYYGPTRAYRGSIWRNYPVGYGEDLFHGFAVNYEGTTVVAEQGRKYRLTQPHTTCMPDSDAPKFGSISINRRAGNVVTFNIPATDRCSRVKNIRFSGPTTTQYWRTYDATPAVRITGGTGKKTFSVTVRDTYGRTSTAVFSFTHTGATNNGGGGGTAGTQGGRRSGGGGTSTNGRLRARSTIRIAGRGSVCTGNPARAIAGTGYRIADRCATFRGRVRKIQNRGSWRYVLVTVSRTTARKMFVNARASTNIWVVGPRRLRSLRVGRPAVFTTPVTVNRSRTTVVAMPAYHWYRS